MWIKKIQWDGSTQFYPNRPLRFFKKKWYHADWFFTFIDEDAVVISILRRFISQWFLYTYWFYTYGKFLNWVIPKSPWVSILFQGHPWRLNDLGYPHDCGHSNRPWHCSCRTTMMIFSARWTARWTHQKLFQKKLPHSGTDFAPSAGTISKTSHTMRNFSQCSWSGKAIPIPTALSGNLPSGKHTKNYGKSPFSWENSLFLWPFSIALCMFTKG